MIHNKRINKKSILVSGIIIILLLAVGVTLTVLHEETESVENLFTNTDVSGEIIENFNGEVKSDVKIKNTGNTNAYIRVKLIYSWYKKAGEGSSAADVHAAKTDWTPNDNNKVDGEAIFNTSEGGWFYCASDGFYYYAAPVAPDGTTNNLINKIKLLSDNDGTYQGLEIIADTIQAKGSNEDGESPAEDAWGVTINDDGTIIK